MISSRHVSEHEEPRQRALLCYIFVPFPEGLRLDLCCSDMRGIRSWFTLVAARQEHMGTEVLRHASGCTALLLTYVARNAMMYEAYPNLGMIET